MKLNRREAAAVLAGSIVTSSITLLETTSGEKSQLVEPVVCMTEDKLKELMTEVINSFWNAPVVDWDSTAAACVDWDSTAAAVWDDIEHQRSMAG